jgi:hypothetical protein
MIEVRQNLLASLADAAAMVEKIPRATPIVAFFFLGVEQFCRELGASPCFEIACSIA